MAFRTSKSKLALTISLASIATTLHAAPNDAEWAALQARVSQLEEQLDSRSGSTGNNATTLGGYGELHYTNLDNNNPAGSDSREIDLHRFVFLVGHQFTHSIRLFSELEVEHAFLEGGAGGAIELEQAYLEFDLNDTTQAQGGLFLLPVGILNETHEPPTFYGVERNPVEKAIIPVTWREGGALLRGHTRNGFSYDVALHSGLYAPDYQIRDGRQQASEAQANALAYTARVKWTGMPGLELALSLNHQNDITQGSAAKIAGNLLESHLVYTTGPFMLKALYAGWRLDDNGSANGMERQSGWYVEPSYKISEKVGLFARHNRWDNAAGDNADSLYRQTNVGVNYWPHPDVVLKADLQNQQSPAGKDEYRGFNLGIGFQF